MIALEACHLSFWKILRDGGGRRGFRTGYFHESQIKGIRRYFTFGLGVRYRFLTWDISYLLPESGKNSPLYNTLRFSMLAEFGD